MQVREYTAAGGVVLDDGDRVLLLERWVEREGEMVHEIRLPKGHVEPGETDEQAAARETCEESGYCCVEITGDLGTTFTHFTNASEEVHRTEHYFLMRLTEPEQGKQHFQSEDEAKFRTIWAPDFDGAERDLTYESEKLFIARARVHLAASPTPNAET